MFAGLYTLLDIFERTTGFGLIYHFLFRFLLIRHLSYSHFPHCAYYTHSLHDTK